jgi:hypothetical protein
MKLVGFVVLGLVASFVVFEILLLWILSAFPDTGGCGALWLPFLIIMPVSLLLGSIITGFLSCPTLNSRWGLFFIAPGLYGNAATIFSGFLMSGFLMEGFRINVGVLLFLVLLLYWYLASLAGTAFGYFLRLCIRRARHSE